MANPELDGIIRALKAADDRQTFRRIDFFEPYPKQQEFMDGGSTFRERLLMAGNQLGKTFCGAAETAYHLTGEYPDDWLGRRWDRPTRGWAAGESALVVRDVQQRLLCGEPGVESLLGSGMIPKNAILDTSLGRSVTDGFDLVQVKHKTGGVSILGFKSYEQGRKKFQGATQDFVWFDEEPDEEIYAEGLTRVTATGGMTFMTFTPLKGMSKVVVRFLNEESPDRMVVNMTIDDARHIPEEMRARIIAGYLEHERDARARGIPMLGSGLIFPFSMDQIGETTPLEIPEHWTKLWAIDFGIGHNFAAVLMAWDKDFDTLHILHTIRVRGGTALTHAAAMKPIGVNVPVAWPHDGNNRDKGSGEVLATIYRQQGLRMLPSHATWPEGGYSVEAGILEMQQRMGTGRFKVGRHLGDWWEEQRMYHREDGQIVKAFDDLMSASRIGVMAKRHGQHVNLGGTAKSRRGGHVALDIDFDLS